MPISGKQTLLWEKLKSAKKGGIGFNSFSFWSVKRAMKKVNSLLDQPMSETNARKMIDAQKKLQEKSRSYLKSREGKATTTAGKERVEIVKLIEMTTKDSSINQLRDPKVIRDYNASGRSLSSAIEDYRHEFSDITTKSKKVYGAGASRRTRFRYNGKDGMFTVSDEGLTKDDKLSLLKRDFEANYGNLFNTPEKKAQLKAFMQETDDIYCEIDRASAKDVLANYSIDMSIFTEETIQAMKKFVGDVHSINNGVNTKTDAGISELSRTDKRNVATTQMAKFFNMEDKIAQTEYMRVKDKDSEGHDIEKLGSFMLFADGTDVRSDEGLKFFSDTETVLNSPSFQRDCNRMEVFDLVCGQIDRHAGNMLYKGEMKDGKFVLTGVTGIDNDLSFGTITDITQSHSNMTRLLGKDETFIEKKGNPWSYTLEMIDEDMYDTLKSKLTRESIEYLFDDTLSNEEKDAIIARKDAILDAVDRGSVTVIKENEWGTATAERSARSKYGADIKKEISNAKNISDEKRAVENKEFEEKVARIAAYNQKFPDTPQAVPVKNPQGAAVKKVAVSLESDKVVVPISTAKKSEVVLQGRNLN